MKKLLLLIVMLFGISAFSQVGNENEIVEAADRAPTFTEGIGSFRTEFAKNLNANKVKGKGNYRTVITFVVERDGTISEIEASGDNESFNEQAVKAIKKIKTKWLPAKVKGNTVRSRFKFPATMNIR